MTHILRAVRHNYNVCRHMLTRQFLRWRARPTPKPRPFPPILWPFLPVLLIVCYGILACPEKPVRHAFFNRYGELCADQTRTCE